VKERGYRDRETRDRDTAGQKERSEYFGVEVRQEVADASIGDDEADDVEI